MFPVKPLLLHTILPISTTIIWQSENPTSFNFSPSLPPFHHKTNCAFPYPSLSQIKSIFNHTPTKTKWPFPCLRFPPSPPPSFFSSPHSPMPETSVHQSTAWTTKTLTLSTAPLLRCSPSSEVTPGPTLMSLFPRPWTLPSPHSGPIVPIATALEPPLRMEITFAAHCLSPVWYVELLAFLCWLLLLLFTSLSSGSRVDRRRRRSLSQKLLTLLLTSDCDEEFACTYRRLYWDEIWWLCSAWYDLILFCFFFDWIFGVAEWN